MLHSDTPTGLNTEPGFLGAASHWPWSIFTAALSCTATSSQRMWSWISEEMPSWWTSDAARSASNPTPLLALQSISLRKASLGKASCDCLWCAEITIHVRVHRLHSPSLQEARACPVTHGFPHAEKDSVNPTLHRRLYLCCRLVGFRGSLLRPRCPCLAS